MTPEFKNELLMTLSAWVLLFFAKLVPFIPQLQVIAILLAIFSTFVTILLNIPKLIKIIKGYLK
jgi:hypothetical protein